MAKAKSLPTPPRRQLPATGGSSFRDKVTGELTPNPLPADEPAPPAEPVQPEKDA